MADEDEIMIRVRTPIALAREAQRVAALHDESVSQVIRRKRCSVAVLLSAA